MVIISAYLWNCFFREPIISIKVMLAKKGQTNMWLSEQVSKDPVAVSKWCTNMVQPTLIGED